MRIILIKLIRIVIELVARSTCYEAARSMYAEEL